jgi:hypothetical protein
VINKTLKKVIIGAMAVLSVGGATLGASAASAHPWGGGWGWRGGGYHGYGYGPGPVLAAGVLGVAIGASLDRPYYGAPPGYYAGPGYYGYYEGCRSYWRWSPHWGRYVREESCY